MNSCISSEQICKVTLTSLNNIAQQKSYDEECTTRIDREKDILQALDDEKYKLHKKIDDERTDKSLKFGAFRDDTKN